MNRKPTSMAKLAILSICMLTTTTAAATALAQSNGAGSKYAIIELAAPNQNTYAFAISNAGDVCGAANSVAFEWREGHVKALQGIVRGASPEGHAVNSLGVVAGFSRGTLYNSTEATVWNGGNPPFGLGSLGGDFSEAHGINELNHVVGVAALTNDTNNHAFLWIDGNMQDLGTLAEPYGSFAWGINNLDQIAGYSFIALGTSGAVLWDHGTMTNLGTLGGNQSKATAINDLAQIVGYSYDSQSNDVAFLWQDGVMQNIHDYSFGNNSGAYGINNHTQVVGQIPGDGFLQTDAFIWDPVNGMHNIEEFLPPDSGWDLTWAWSISDYGQIAGYGTHQAHQVAYMVTPVTPTLHMDDPNPGRAGTNNTFTIHNADPGKTIYFIYGRKGGGYLIPGCNSQSGAVLQMDDPTIIGSTTADVNGNASITAFVPNAARNAGDILIQAVEQSHCKISQLVVTRFQ